MNDSLNNTSEQDQDENARRFVRLPRSYRVHLKKLSFGGGGGTGFECTASNISKGGICLDTPRTLSKGEQWQVRIQIPRLNRYSSTFFKFYENDGDQYFLAIADVSWVKGNRAGLRFVNTDVTQANALEALIKDAMRSKK